MPTRPNTTAHRRRLRACVSFFLLSALLAGGTGCSLFVMAGKALFGDPLQEAAFSRSAHVDLTAGLHKTLVVASTPEGIKAEHPAINYDLLDHVTRRMKANNVTVINSNEVATWLDDNGGYWDDINELAAAFDTDFIVHIEVDQVRYQEPNSPDLLQGYITGTVFGYRVRESEDGGERRALRVFQQSFEYTYPEGHPKLADRMSMDVFQREFIERISQRLAHLLYDHRASEEVF